VALDHVEHGQCHVKEEEYVHCSRDCIAPAFMGINTPSKARAIAFAMKGDLSCRLVMYGCMACGTSKESLLRSTRRSIDPIPVNAFTYATIHGSRAKAFLNPDHGLFRALSRASVNVTFDIKRLLSSAHDYNDSAMPNAKLEVQTMSLILFSTIGLSPVVRLEMSSSCCQYSN
jgi:hypothetical protein